MVFTNVTWGYVATIRQVMVFNIGSTQLYNKWSKEAEDIMTISVASTLEDRESEEKMHFLFSYLSISEKYRIRPGW